MTHDDFLDPGTAERLLDGSVAPADAPPGFGPVAELLDAARGGVTPPAADVGALAVAARAGAGSTVPPESPTPGRAPVLAKFLTLKAAAVAGVVLLGATSAAAATGSLPGPLQRTAHSTLSHVGVTVPSADDDATDATEVKGHDGTEVGDPTTTTTAPADPNAVPPTDPATAGADDPTEHNGQPEAEDPSGDHQGQDPAAGQDDQGENDGEHGGTTATTQPGGTTPPVGEDGGHGGSGSGSGDSGSGGSGSGDSGSGGHGGQD